MESEDLKKILDTAEALFRKYGIRSVTMADIARDLGMSKKTLYLHVENKRDLIDKTLQRHIVDEKGQCLNIIETASDALEELLHMSIYIQKMIQDMNPSLIFDLKKYHRPIWEKLERYEKEFVFSIVKENLKRGIKEGLYRANLNAEIVSRIYIGTFPMFSDDELFPFNQFPRSELHKAFVRYHINGIVSEEGRKLLDAYLRAYTEKNENLL
ncbi:MAG: TetR/AcrR family transcriptional regulator [Aureispira sp.]|nr:TetR/AcrR family transcriptional regulator [Aureispira sp.]